MQLRSAFQYSIYGLAGLSSVILAVSEGTNYFPAISVPVALMALFFTEKWNKFHLTTSWANALGLLAFGIAAVEFMGGEVEERIFAGAHLLLYLSWIVLFQEKKTRQYWWVCALSVLQVAVASVLAETALFGVLVLIYLVLAIWTLSVFSLYQTEQQFAKAEHYAVQSTGRVGSVAATVDVLQPAQGEVVVAGEPAAEASNIASGSMTRGTVQRDPNVRWINGRFVCGVGFVAVMATLIGFIFFWTIPRVWVGGLPSFSSKPDKGIETLTGFTETVSLGDIGEILESSEPVLELQIFNDSNNQPIAVDEYARKLGLDEPYFRGAVMDEYKNGRWSTRFEVRVGPRLPRTPPRPDLIRQEIRIEPIGTDLVFALHPVWVARADDNRPTIRKQNVTAVLFHANDRSRTDSMKYYAYSPNPDAEVPQNDASQSSSRRSLIEQGSPALIQAVYARLPQEDMPRLVQLARNIVAQNVPSNKATALNVAKVLESYLRDSPEYTYSLNSSITDSSIDPIEDFLFNRKSGHCEYYASALALMLRAVGIPSRLISGFKGGDLNDFTNKYIVQQRHAHAWVEAHIDGSWVILDATPADGRLESVESLAPTLPTWEDLSQMLSVMWSEQIVNLSLAQQRDLVYTPLQNIAIAVSRIIRQRIAEITGLSSSLLGSDDDWFSWKIWAITFIFLWVMYLFLQMVRRLLPILLSIIKNRILRRRKRHRQGVDFYERFQKLLAKDGLSRDAFQTQREFANQVEQDRKNQLAASGLDHFPDDITDLFYRVRFGERPLSESESQTISKELQRLESCLESRP